MPGLDSHRENCPCPRCQGKARTAERERAEAEQAATVRACARGVTWMASQVARQRGGSAPDVLRQALGAEDAVRVLRMAGYDAGQVRQASVQRVNGSSSNGLFGADPRHDKRFVDAQIHGGSPAGALQEIAEDPLVPPVMARRAALALAKHAAGMPLMDALEAAEIELARAPYTQPSVRPASLVGAAAASMGEDGVLRSRSVVHREVAEPGTGAEAAGEQLRQRDQLLGALEGGLGHG